MANNYYNFPVPFIAGTKVRSDQVNTQYSGIEAGFDLLSTDPDASIIGTSFFGTDVQGATVNEYLITTPDPRTPLVNGQRVSFFATHSNDGAVTLNVDGTGLIAGVNLDGDAVVDGQIVSGQFYEWVYDNANTQWLVTKGISGITDPLLLSNGSAAAPTYSFELDPDTGMYRQAADALGLSAGGIEVIRLINVGGGNEQLVVEPDRTNNSSIPSLAFGDADSGFKESADDSLVLLLASVDKWFWAADTYGSLTGTGPAMLNESASGTNPTLIPDRSDGDTGLGHNGAGEPSLIGNGVELARGVAAGSGGLLANNTLTGGGLERVLTTGDAGGLVGDVFKVGTPVDNQVGVWTGDGTIEGDTNFTWDGSQLTFSGYTFPAADGSADQFLVTDGAGNLTFRNQAAGGMLSAGYRFSTSTAAADPGSGRFRYDNATPASITQIFIDDETNNGVDISNILSLITTGDRMYFQSDGDASQFQVFNVTAPATDNTGWFTIDVSVEANGTLHDNNDRCTIVLQIGGASAVGDVFKVGTPVNNEVGVWTGDGTIEGDTNFTWDGTTLIVTGNLTVTGTLTGVGDVTKVGTPVDNQVGVWTGDGTIEGTTGLTYDGSALSVTGNIGIPGTTRPLLRNVAATSAVPNIHVDSGDLDTGFGDSGGDTLSVICGGVEAQRWSEFNAGILEMKQLFSPVTATPGGGQGGADVLESSYNVVATVATAGDSVKLAGNGLKGTVTYVKNDGANAMDVFPASGQDLGAGTNVAVSVPAGTSAAFQCTVAASTWTQFIFPKTTGAGDVFKVGTPSNDQLAVWTGDGTLEGSANFDVVGTQFRSVTGNGPAIVDEAASSGNPTLIPRQGDLDTGVTNVGDDRLGLTAGGQLGMQLVEASSGVIHGFDIDAAVTAFAGGGQGSAVQLNQSYNIVTTVATTGDSIKLPPINHVGGLVYIKNDGANALDVFPASGDDLGQGTDTALSVSAGAAVTFMHSVSNTTWTQIQFEEVAGTGDVTKVGTPVDNEIGVWTGDGTIEGDTNFQWTGSQLIVAVLGSAAAPAIAIGDGDTGFYESIDDTLAVTLGGVQKWAFTGDSFVSQLGTGAGLLNEAVSATNPTLLPNRGDPDSGIGQNAADQVSLIGGGVELLRAVEATGANQIIVAPGVIQDAEATPSLAFGDGDTGFYEEVDDTLAVALSGVKEFEFGPLAGADAQFGDVEMLSNMDGSDGQTTFTEQSNNGASATFVATAELDTAQFKFGTASLLLDGNSDYIHYPDIAGYDLAANVWTIEGWVRFNSLPAIGDEMYLISQWVQGGGTDEAFAISVIQDGSAYRFRFEAEDSFGVFEQGNLGGAPALNTWFHWAVQRSASDRLTLWFDGTEEFDATSIFSGSINNSTTTLKLGVRDPTQTGEEGWLDGWIDDVRMTIGSTRYTPGGAITPPTAAFPTNSGQFTGATAGAGKLFNQVGSMTTPTLAPRNDDDDTGIGGDGDDVLSVIVGGFEALRYTELNDAVITAPEANLAVTAFATGGQGSATQLDSGSNVITTVATTGDSVKLPPVFAANSVVYVKNDGANAADIFPASGDDLGAGTDTAVSIPAGSSMSFIATVANSTWTQWIVDTFGAGDVTKVGTPVNNQLGVWTGDGTIEGDANLTWDASRLTIGASGLILPAGSAAGPSVVFTGSLGSGIYTSATNVISVSITGAEAWNFNTAFFDSSISAGPKLMRETGTRTNPTLIPLGTDDDTGIGGSGADVMTAVAGGVEGQHWREGNAGVQVGYATSPTVTAFATGGQGGATVLINSYSVVTTVATTGDSVRLQTNHDLGTVVYCKNEGANSLDIFPASGDDLGAGVDTAVAIPAGEFKCFITTVAQATWTELLPVAAGGDVTKVGTPVNNEVGVWTGDGTIEGDTNFQFNGSQLILLDGTSALPAYSFVSDPNTGMYRVAENRIGFVADGTDVVEINDVQFLGPISGVGQPGISFIVDPDTGIDRNAADQLQLISGGVEMLRAIEAGTSATDQIFLPRDGAVATPALALGATNHGFYTAGVAQINAAISGARKIFFNSSAFTGDGVSIGVALSTGPRMLNETPTATNPSIVPNQNDGDTGLGWNAAGEPSLVGNGVELARGVAAASGGLQANNADTGGGLERVLTESDLALPEFQFFADQFENPVNADWTVNALAPAAADSNNNGLTVRLFDDTTEEGVGFIVEVPAGATSIVFDFVSRAETAPGVVNTVGLDIYNRGVPDNAAVQAWSTATQLTDLSIPTNEFFQEDTQTVTLATLGITAGETTQFELVRTTPTGGTDLTGDWALLLAKVSFT